MTEGTALRTPSMPGPADIDDTPQTRAAPGPMRLAGLFLAVFVAHVVFFAVMRSHYPEWIPEEIPRNGWYSIAKNVAAGRGFTLDSLLTYFPTSDGRLVPTASRGPVPILFLAAMILVFPSPYYPVLITCWLMSAGTTMFVYGVARRVTRSFEVAILASILSGFHLSEMYISTTFSYCSEPIFIFALSAAVYFAVLACERNSVRISAASGLCLGIACLARQIVLLLPTGYFVLFWFARRRRFASLSLAACLMFLCIQIPWWVRNELAFGKPVITSTLAGYGAYLNAVTARDNSGLGYEWPDTRAARAEMLTALTAAGLSIDSISETDFDQFLLAQAKPVIEKHRGQYVTNSLSSIIYLLYRHNSGRGLYAAQNAVYYAFALLGVLVAWRRRSHELLFLVALIAYFVLIYAPFIPQYRYFLPVAPYMFIFTALGLHWCWSGLRPARWREQKVAACRNCT